jgi:hypothetical protein
MVTETQVLINIKALASYKAPGPDGIPNIVLQQTAELITPYLTQAFKFMLDTGYHYSGWKSFTTVVLQKPGKPSYDALKAYRPIALLCTMGKLLTAIIAEETSRILELEGQLLTTHFGERPCQTTTDAVHHLVDRIKGT